VRTRQNENQPFHPKVCNSTHSKARLQKSLPNRKSISEIGFVVSGVAENLPCACCVKHGQTSYSTGLNPFWSTLGPELELCTNLAENSMRPIAVGRANWIHMGSEQAGPRVAAILSVVESCRRLKIPIRNYRADILPGLANAPVQRIADIIPAVWATRHP
jgi:hypothetical protein